MSRRPPDMNTAPHGALRAALIDLDGTLMDTAPDIAAATNRLREDFGMTSLPEARIAQFVGKGVDLLIHRALTDDINGQVDAERFARARESFRRHYSAINGSLAVVFDPVPVGLAKLREAGLRVGCVTNKHSEFTTPLLARAGLRDLLDVVVTADEVAHGKPHPDVIFEACRRLGVRTQETVLIGDSANDVQAAHAAGSRCVLVETGYNEGEPVHTLLEGEGGADALFPDFAGATQWALQAARADMA